MRISSGTDAQEELDIIRRAAERGLDMYKLDIFVHILNHVELLKPKVDALKETEWMYEALCK